MNQGPLGYEPNEHSELLYPALGIAGPPGIEPGTEGFQPLALPTELKAIAIYTLPGVAVVHEVPSYVPGPLLIRAAPRPVAVPPVAATPTDLVPAIGEALNPHVLACHAGPGAIPPVRERFHGRMVAQPYVL